MNNSISNLSLRNLKDGGNVSLKMSLLIAMMFLCVSGQAADKQVAAKPAMAKSKLATKPKLATSQVYEQIKKDQESAKKINQFLKSDYSKSEKNRIKQGDIKIKENCESKNSSFLGSAKCLRKSVAQSTDFKWKRTTQGTVSLFGRTQQYISDIWAAIKAFFSSATRGKGKFRNDLPDPGGLWIYTNSSGPHAKYFINANNELIDPNGEVVSVEYDFGDGSVMRIPMEELSNNAAIQHVFPGEGTYTVTLKVYDNENEYAEVSQDVVVTDNVAPAPTYTYVVTTGNTVEFTANANDPENSIDRYVWSFDDGSPSQVVNTNTLTYEFATSGLHTVVLEVWDTAGAVNYIQRNIFVDASVPTSELPNVVLKMDKVFGEGPLTVNFDASLSMDANSAAVASYEWEFGDNDSFSNTSILASPSHKYNAPGTYGGVLRVKDTNDNTAEIFFTVYVKATSNGVPQIIATKGDYNRQVEFFGSSWVMPVTANWDSYRWDLGDENRSQGLGATNVYAVDGTYSVRLVVHDIQGIRHVVQKEVSIKVEPDKPTAQISVDSVNQEAGETYSYSAEGSVDSQENQSLSYAWDFSDGTRFSGEEYENVEHEFDVRGRYPVRLIVTNSRGMSAVATLEAFVQEGATLKSNFTYNPKIGVGPLEVEFDSAATVATETIIEKIWKFSDDSSVMTDTATKTFSDIGTHWVKLFVKDDLGNESYAMREIVVLDAGEIPPGNIPPVASLTVSQNPSNHLFTLDANTSTDTDSSIKFYEWRIDGNLQVDGKILNVALPAGNHIVELTAIDEWGAVHVISKVVKSSGGASPNLTYDASPNPAIKREVTYFSADESVVDADPSNFRWDFGDGNFAKGAMVQHVYASVGTYTVKLTIKDSAGIVRTFSDNIIVQELDPFTLNLSISDSASSFTISDSETVEAHLLPATLNYSVAEGDSQFDVKDADWDFGDGESGFGTKAEHTYHKPGTYTVTVTGKDAIGRNSTSTATVIVPEGECGIGEVENGEADENYCINITNAHGNILPFSEISWTIDLGSGAEDLSTDTTEYTSDWIRLIELDAVDESTATIVNLADIVSISGKQIIISKTGLEAKTFDMSKAYRLEFVAKDINGVTVKGSYPRLYMGNSSLAITVDEPQMYIIVNEPKALFKKYIKMGNDTSKSIQDLPPGEIIVEATVSSRSDTFQVSLTSRKRALLNLDLSEKSISRRASEQLDRRVKGSPKGIRYAGDSWGFCDEDSPFPFGPTVEPTPGYWGNCMAGSFDVEEKECQKQPSDAFLKQGKVTVRCEVWPQVKVAGVIKWLYHKTGASCGVHFPEIAGDPILGGGSGYLGWYTAVSYEETLPFELKYDFTEIASGKTTKGKVLFSPIEWRLKENLTYERITYELGYGNQAAYARVFTFEAPKGRSKFHFDVRHFGPLYYSETRCTLMMPMPGPRIESIEADATKSSTIPFTNAQNSLVTFGVFPIQQESGVTANQTAWPSNYKSGTKLLAYQAAYQIKIVNRELPTDVWTGVRVELSYNGASRKKDFTFTGTAIKDGAFIGRFLFDLNESFDGTQFEMDPTGNAKTVDVTFTPIGAKEAEPITKTFKALFNARHEINGTICSNGFYNETGSTARQQSSFGRIGLLKYLSELSNTHSLGVRCNDFSLPFGGLFKISKSWRHDGHTLGLEADTRYFNTSSSEQDAYDRLTAAAKISDIKAYMAFSKAASEATTQNKTDLLAFCTGSGIKAPCESGMVAASLTKDIILKLCQWYPTVPTGCPANTASARLAVKRYSKWIRETVKGFDIILGLGNSIISSTGNEILFSFDGSDIRREWQKLALFEGRWPPAVSDGLLEPVYSLDSSGEISSNLVESCKEEHSGVCPWTEENIIPKENHIHHFHSRVSQ